MSQAHRWLVRPYRGGDECQLAALSERVFGRAPTDAHWWWKLGRASPIDTIWLAEYDGRVISHCAGIPTPFRIPSGASTIMVAVDAMTDPSFRRRGLLTDLSRTMYDRWREAGIPLVLGLPNQQWGSRTAALGWQKLFPLQWLVRVIRPTALAMRKLGWRPGGEVAFLDSAWHRACEMLSPPDGTISVEQVHHAGAEFDQLWRAVEPSSRYSVRRDASWVTWRYLSSPDVRYRVLLASRSGDPCGYAAIRTPGPTATAAIGHIADLVVRPGDRGAQSTLINAAVGALNAEGLAAVATLAAPGTSIYRGMRRAGFLPYWGAFTIECVPLAASISLEDMRVSSNWHIAGGDFDVV